MSYGENAILEPIKKVSKSVDNICTKKIVHNSFYQAIPVGGILQIGNVEPNREDLVVQVHKRKVGEKLTIFALQNGREISLS